MSTVVESVSATVATLAAVQPKYTITLSSSFSRIVKFVFSGEREKRIELEQEQFARVSVLREHYNFELVHFVLVCVFVYVCPM